MIFEHPLARDAKVWLTAGKKGKPQGILVIITTLELNKDHKKFKADKIRVLSDAAAVWIAENSSDAVDFILMNRPKDWAGDSKQ